MPRKCTICEHERSEQITQALLRGIPYRELVDEYGVSMGALHRHKQHITAQMMNSADAVEVSEPGIVMRRIALLNERAEQLYNEALKQKDTLNAVRVLKELREIVALYAKLTGELNTQSQVVHQHVHISSEWVALRQTMLNALAPYPEARAALIAALEGAQALAGGDADV